MSPDGRTVIVDLRTDVRFHDGEPFTADDVVFTWEALTDPALASPVYGSFDLKGLVTSGEAVDADTVRFQLGRNDPSFTEKLYVGIVPEHILTGQDLKSTEEGRLHLHPRRERPHRARPGQASRSIVWRNELDADVRVGLALAPSLSTPAPGQDRRWPHRHGPSPDDCRRLTIQWSLTGSPPSSWLLMPVQQAS
ncbi:MAG: ABC transporter substrate-binding protein [Pseudonocardia sp.]